MCTLKGKRETAREGEDGTGMTGGRKGHGVHLGSEHEAKCQRVCENRRAALSGVRSV